MNKFSKTLEKYLSQGRLNHVIEVLLNNSRSHIEKHPDLQRVITALEPISRTYSYMRDFMLSGQPDAEREKVYASLKDSLRAAARSYLFILGENSLNTFFAEYRLQKVRNQSVAELAERYRKNRSYIALAKETEADFDAFARKEEEIVDSIFRKVWTLPPWAADDLKTVASLLRDNEIGFNLKSQLISAILLSQLCFDDPDKFLTLLDFLLVCDDEKLAARAMVAAVLILGRPGESLASNPGVISRLQAIADSIVNYSRIRDVVTTIVRTFDTDRVSREVKEAFSAAMGEISPELLDKLRREGLTADSSETGMNPEWEKLLKNSDIEERMKNINDMQLEGMDVMMQSFAQLKHFPFFRSVSSWFLPFSVKASAVASVFESFNPNAFEALAEATDMCSSDCYSFALGLSMMPQERREALVSHINQSIGDIEDMTKDRANVRRKSLFASEALRFARDIYRFVKLFPKKADFRNPFDSSLDFLGLPVLSDLLDEENFISATADFYFRHGYYPEALPLYEKIVAEGESVASVYERIGFCYQMAGDFIMALDGYEKAELFTTDTMQASTWLLKKLAFCNKAVGRFNRAEEFYKRLLERDKDNLSLEFHLGSVLLRQEKLDEAMERLSKVHYLEPEHKGCTRVYIRGLLLRSLREGQPLDEALNAAFALTAGDSVEPADYRVAAHVAYCAGKLREAADWYAKSGAEREEIVEDIRYLQRDAFKEEDLRIVLDF